MVRTKSKLQGTDTVHNCSDESKHQGRLWTTVPICLGTNLPLHHPTSSGGV